MCLPRSAGSTGCIGYIAAGRCPTDFDQAAADYCSTGSGYTAVDYCSTGSGRTAAGHCSTDCFGNSAGRCRYSTGCFENSPADCFQKNCYSSGKLPARLRSSRNTVSLL